MHLGLSDWTYWFIQFITLLIPAAEISCVKGLHLWRNSSDEINDELYKGYRKGNPEEKINEIIAGCSGALCINVLTYSMLFQYCLNFVWSLFAAYDFLNSDRHSFNVIIWYNSTYKNDTGNQPIALTRVPRSVNLVNLSLSTSLFFLCKLFLALVNSVLLIIAQWRKSLIDNRYHENQFHLLE